jgi:hypothetical protein
MSKTEDTNPDATTDTSGVDLLAKVEAVRDARARYDEQSKALRQQNKAEVDRLNAQDSALREVFNDELKKITSEREEISDAYDKERKRIERELRAATGKSPASGVNIQRVLNNGGRWSSGWLVDSYGTYVYDSDGNRVSRDDFDDEDDDF